jgi:hypothetical protein
MSLPDNNELNISRSYSECLQKFRKFLIGVGNKSSQSEALREPDVTKALEKYGRLRTWGEETCGALPSSSRGSLDDKLRNDEDMKKTIVRTLQRLKRGIEAGISNIF